MPLSVVINLSYFSHGLFSFNNVNNNNNDNDHFIYISTDLAKHSRFTNNIMEETTN